MIDEVRTTAAFHIPLLPGEVTACGAWEHHVPSDEAALANFGRNTAAARAKREVAATANHQAKPVDEIQGTASVIITASALEALNTGWKTDFNEGFVGAKSHYADIAMITNSSTADQIYPFLGQIPALREWLGERRLKSLEAHGFKIKNRKFEDTVTVLRTSIEDDQAGVYRPLFREMGRAAGEHPDQLVFELLKNGFTQTCYDGQYFFDSDHQVTGPDGAAATYSNMQAGDGPAWYLLDTSRAIRPLIYQKRMDYQMVAMTDPTNAHVFTTDEYVYGVRGRSNAGYGLYQLAFGSKAPLTKENYIAARTAMMNQRGDEGRPIGVAPTVLVAPQTMEATVLGFIKKQNLTGGESNEYYDSISTILTPWLY